MNDQERAAFEAWGRAEGLEDKAIGRGMDYPLGEHLWRAWQAGRAALAAAPQVPAGFVLVPVEPTAEMLASLTGFDFRGDFDQRRSAMRRGAWAAMLAAAPQAPAGVPSNERFGMTDHRKD